MCSRCGKVAAIGRLHCNSCIRLLWLEEHADEVEEFLAEGLTLNAARRKVYERNRPQCKVCGSDISHGKKGQSLICTKTPQCRSARRRYRTLKEGTANLPATVAMEQVLRELGKL